ncbi:MAG TPA: deoxyribodipyrimidine photo-lyase, partial [Pseudothauera hydrothermalis]|nr:deoxyribodipyrimidine photo-lyase [Pseudothauera hydrothermalis]
MKTALVWFRRDLRSVDHAALSHALTQFERVHCAFVFDTAILDALPSRRDRRVEFIWHSVVELDGALAELAAAAGVQGAGLIVVHGRADDEIPALARELGVQAVLANRDYEPEALARDARVAQRLAADGIAFRAFKDQVVFECDE